MLKMKSWSVARIIFAESHARKREIPVNSHIEPKKTAQFSVYEKIIYPRASHQGSI